MSNIHRKVLNAVTTGTSEIVDTLGQDRMTMAAVFSSGVTAGVVTFESSPDPAFSGTWKSIGTASFTANAVVTVSAGAGDAYRYLRARITTTVVGGTVSVWITVTGKGHAHWS